MRNRLIILGLLCFAVVGTLPMWLHRYVTRVAAQTQHTMHRDRRHMHMKNWALEPTGIPGVFPLDPTTIPKFVNQLTKPPVHVPVGTRFDPQTGRNLPLYVVTAKAIQAQ